MDILASKDPDEMRPMEAFHQCLHCLLRKGQYSETQVHVNLESLTRNSFIWTINYPKCIVSNQMDKCIKEEAIIVKCSEL